MQNFSSTDFAVCLADQMIANRFGKAYGVRTFAEYLDFVDKRATAHLDEYMAQRVQKTAGAQRRKSRLKIENAVTVIIAVPMNDVRKGATIWAEIDLASWLDAIERGADTAWFYAYKGADQRSGQVRCKVPLSGRTSTTNATIVRVLVNAKPGQQARTLDGNPLNLRRENLFLVGNPHGIEGRVGTAKTYTQAQLLELVALRQALSGATDSRNHSGGEQ